MINNIRISLKLSGVISIDSTKSKLCCDVDSTKLRLSGVVYTIASKLSGVTDTTESFKDITESRVKAFRGFN
jgi:hypothetical protein